MPQRARGGVADGWRWQRNGNGKSSDSPTPMPCNTRLVFREHRTAKTEQDVTYIIHGHRPLPPRQFVHLCCSFVCGSVRSQWTPQPGYLLPSVGAAGTGSNCCVSNTAQSGIACTRTQCHFLAFSTSISGSIIVAGAVAVRICTGPAPTE